VPNGLGLAAILAKLVFRCDLWVIDKKWSRWASAPFWWVFWTDVLLQDLTEMHQPTKTTGYEPR
jgi:hypothetical protein